MSEKVLERLKQILAAQVLTLEALVDIEAHLGSPDQGEEAQEGAGSELRSMCQCEG